MLKTSRAWRIGTVLAASALAAAPFAARAQVYKCAQANGSAAYQSTPCPTNTKPAPHPTVAQLNAQRAATPKDDKPYDDPYKNSVSERPHPAPPSLGVGTANAPPRPTTRPEAQSSTSSLVADVQARNKREDQQQAYQEAHKNDKAVNMAACNTARNNLGVLKEQRPVYSYDNKGNRVFVDDKDRANTLAEAQRSIVASCP
jgi:hypothetical protein